MDEQIKNLKFSTKSILLTDKQKEFIESLLDELTDFGDDRYQDLEYWKLSKQDATKIIKELKNIVDDYESDFYRYDYGDDPSYDYYD